MSSDNVWIKKLDNFWYYYKWHVIFGILGIIFAITLINTLVFYPDYDLTVTVVSDTKTDAFIDGLKNDFKGDIQDANKNNKSEAFAIFIATYNPDQNRLVELGTTQSVYSELIQGETTLAFVNPIFFKSYAKAGAFYDLTETASELGVAEEDKYYIDGKVFGINVAKSKYLQSKGMPVAELFMTVMYEKESPSERKVIEHDNAIKVFKAIYNFA